MERKPHFLDNYINELKKKGALTSDQKPGAPWYNQHGDCIVYLASNEAIIADRIDEYLTLYRSALDEHHVIGFQLKGVEALLSEFKYDCLEVKVEAQDGEVQAIALNMMLLRSFEMSKPITAKVRRGYAEAIAKFQGLGAALAIS